MSCIGKRSQRRVLDSVKARKLDETLQLLVAGDDEWYNGDELFPKNDEVDSAELLGVEEEGGSDSTLWAASVRGPKITA